MKIVFIRHGESDYSLCDQREFIGQGRNFAPLTDLGITQAEEISKSDDIKTCQIILSSPYTRALQTASIISKNTGIKIAVEVDLHEWRPDKTYQYKTSEEAFRLHNDFACFKGIYPNNETRKWETINEIIERVIPVINKYYDLHYNKIAIVAHGGVIRRFTGKVEVKHCVPYEIDYYKNFKCYGWID